ncbi:MAG: HD domain-containing protein [Clostridia bacterium]|nr:HD domain-containing protein [Clostridia bacterium]
MRVRFFGEKKKKSIIVFLCAALSALTVLQLSGVCFADPGDGPTAENASGNINKALSVDPTGLSEGFSAVLYDITNGLPTSEANAIAETNDGFIWIGSYAGLIRYDGNTFERMDSTGGITSVTSLFVDSGDRLWIGTNANGVAVMERGEFRIWDIRDGLGSSSVRAITEDKNGIIYVATTSGICTIDKDRDLKAIREPGIKDTYIHDIRIGPDGLIYGLTQNGDLFSLRDGETETFIGADDCSVGGVIGILPDPVVPGAVYLGTEDSEVYYGTLKNNFDDLIVRDIAPLSLVERFEYIDGQIWICAGNGIGNINESGFHLLENVPMDNSVSHVMTDYEGNLWFVSTRQGVMKVVPNQFSDIFERYDLPASVVNATCMNGDQLFIATDSGLIVIEDGKRVEKMPLTRAVTASGVDLNASDLLEFLDGVRIRSIIRDSRGRVWISTWRRHGLLRYDHGEITAFTVDDGLLSDRVRVVSERSDGVIMVANTGGISLIEGDRVTKSYSAGSGIVNTEILTVTEGAHDDMILGSDGGGIYIIGNEGTRHIGVNDGLGSEVVMRIKRDPDRGLFWIITANSVSFMDSDYRVETVRNFPYPNNFDLYENSRGDVWILAGNGIYVSPCEELEANGAISPVFYGRDNGLSCITTANSYSELTDDGDLYIAGTTGVVKVNIERRFESVSNLKAAVPFVEADGENIYPNENGSFVIPSSTKKLTVFSFVYNYSLINPQISYQLDGFDQEMTTVSRSDLVPVDYTNLRGGTYRFILEIKDSMGQGNKEFSFVITKEKKLYENLWFMILVSLLILFALEEAVRRYVRARIRKLEKKHKETMTLISEITEAFAKVIDMKDKYTNGHSFRVAKYTSMLAKELGYDDETIEKFHRIALLHDIGKIGVPPEVLNKPGKLTDDEYEIIKLHTSLGYDALKEIHIMPELATGAQAHHERPDGRGYPGHLKGDEIPRVAQIIAVADCFDAMYSNRPYRNRMNFDKVVSIIKEVSGQQLASDVVDAFLRLVEKGEFRDPDDTGGGSTENIENIKEKNDE